MGQDRAIEMITSASVFTPDDDLANPNMVKVVLDRAGNGLYFSRSAIPFVRNDGVRPRFYRHQGIYGYSTKFLLQFVKWKPGILEQAESLEQLRALENGAKIRVLLASPRRRERRHARGCRGRRAPPGSQLIFPLPHPTPEPST